MKQEKEIKDIQIRKEEVKIFLFANDLILQVENLKDAPPQHLMKLMNAFSQVAGHKINVHFFPYIPLY